MYMSYIYIHICIYICSQPAPSISRSTTACCSAATRSVRSARSAGWCCRASRRCYIYVSACHYVYVSWCYCIYVSSCCVCSGWARGVAEQAAAVGEVAGLCRRHIRLTCSSIRMHTHTHTHTHTRTHTQCPHTTTHMCSHAATHACRMRRRQRSSTSSRLYATTYV
jgi:hypothetical protein